MKYKLLFQFVSWFPDWRGFGFYRDTHGQWRVYDWFLVVGFWEIRKWRSNKHLQPPPSGRG